MQVIALVVLLWQRKRIVPLLRRAWLWVKESSAAAPTSSRRSRLAGAAKQATARGWRAVDTEANAGRVARFLSWMRTFASSGVVARTADAPKASA